MDDVHVPSKSLAMNEALNPSFPVPITRPAWNEVIPNVLFSNIRLISFVCPAFTTASLNTNFIASLLIGFSVVVPDVVVVSVGIVDTVVLDTDVTVESDVGTVVFDVGSVVFDTSVFDVTDVAFVVTVICDVDFVVDCVTADVEAVDFVVDCVTADVEAVDFVVDCVIADVEAVDFVVDFVTADVEAVDFVVDCVTADVEAVDFVVTFVLDSDDVFVGDVVTAVPDPGSVVSDVTGFVVVADVVTSVVVISASFVTIAYPSVPFAKLSEGILATKLNPSLIKFTLYL